MTIIFATLAEHPAHRYPENGTLKSLVPGDLVAVELPPNCSVDGGTSEVQDMLAQVEEHLRMRVRAAYGGADGSARAEQHAAWKDNLDWIAADTIARVRTLLGAPRDARSVALERLFDAASILETFGPYEDCSEPERLLRDVVKDVRATEGE